MPPAARVTDMHTCPMSTGPVPHVGGPILPPGAPTVLIDFLPAATVTTMATCVGPPDVIIKGSSGVFINFLPAARLGDQTAHGGVIILGSPTCIIGEVGSPSPGAGGMGAIVAGMVVSGADNFKPEASEYSSPGSAGGAPAGGAGGGANASGLPTSPPADVASAPQTINIPPDVNQSMNDLWGKSFPDGKSQEFGGMIVQDSNGKMSMVNQKGGNSGSFLPDRTLPPGTKEVGLFHTHPYDKTEGGYTGVSFSGADISIAANRSEPSYVQSGATQFLALPTKATPTDTDYKALNAAQNARIQQLVDSGVPMDQASRTAAQETAQKLNMAYYEGSNGVLNRVGN